MGVSCFSQLGATSEYWDGLITYFLVSLWGISELKLVFIQVSSSFIIHCAPIESGHLFISSILATVQKNYSFIGDPVSDEGKFEHWEVRRVWGDGKGGRVKCECPWVRLHFYFSITGHEKLENFLWCNFDKDRISTEWEFFKINPHSQCETLR